MTGTGAETMTPEQHMRIGDAERDAAITALGEHLAAGRITHDEFDERSNAAAAARFTPDLDRLFTDLPALHPPRSASSISSASASSGQRSGWGPRPASPELHEWRRGPRARSVPWLPVILIAIALTIWLHFPFFPLVLIALFLIRWHPRHHARRSRY